MAGGGLKASGIVLIIAGALMVVAGSTAAAYSLLAPDVEPPVLLVVDTDRALQVQSAVVGGGFMVGIGLMLIIPGVILAHASGLHGAATSSDACVTRWHAPATARRVWMVAGTIAVLVLVAGGLTVAIAGADGRGDDVGALGRGAHVDSPPSRIETFEGRVTGARMPVVGAANTPTSEATHLLDPGFATGFVSARLDWRASPTGADQLTLILEAHNGSAWAEIARGEGGPGLTVMARFADAEDGLRARVLVGGVGVGDQPYELVVTLAPSG